MDSDRAQLYTIEGVIGALVILSAVVFAIQSVAVSPTSSGDVGPTERTDLRYQANDVLSIASQNDTFDLNRLVRYWSQSKQTFYGGLNPRLGYGERRPPGAIGHLLNETFTTRSRSYNLVMRYRASNGSGTLTTPIVRTGPPAENAVIATRTVTLYDSQTLTSPGAGGVELRQYDTDPYDGDDGYYPVPDAMDGPLYNVVEVRLIVW